jgi:hypothetical protein
MTILLDEPDQVVTTPTVGRVFRRARFWFGVALFVAVVIVAYNLLAPQSLTEQPLSPTGTGMTGSGALVQVLRQHGVSVTATTSLTAAKNAIGDRGQTSLLVYDPSHYLDSQQLASIPDLAANVIVVSPGKAAVHDLDPSISLIGTAAAAPAARCSLPAAVKAARIADGGHAYRVTAGATSYARCFPSGDNDFSLVQHSTKTSTFTVVGTTNAFTNRYIGDSGNAALAINLLGASPRLVWYLPSLEDVGASGKTISLAQAAPAWFTSFAVLALLVIIAAAVWRGRRFGPLVVEQMPVIVRSSETMEGRARLYQTSSARVRALDSLRIGAISRIGRMCGLPRTADVDQVVTAAASATGRTPPDVRDVLIDGVPGTDAELVRRSDELLELESDVARATGRMAPAPSSSRDRQRPGTANTPEKRVAHDDR